VLIFEGWFQIFLSGLGNAVSSVYPLLRSHPNWTLDSNEFRSQTAQDSSIENLLDGNSTFSLSLFQF
jgi:hypothetical protein